VTLLLDTHVLLWSLLGSPRLREHAWLDRYRPWVVSPVSFLEVQFLAEVGRLRVEIGELVATVAADARFRVDDIGLAPLVRHALPLAWTRDPFDRLLAAHSTARRLPLCTLDRTMRAHHRLLPTELAR
jgi:PIN domain nuclease of toxin-antitoxin system